MQTNRQPYRESPRLELLKRMPQSAVCAEIGVWKGEFSKEILEITVPKKLHLIDPWKFQKEFPNRWYGGRQANNQEDMDEIFQSVYSMFRDTPGVMIHRGFSEDVLQEFEDHYFDWLYIDGNHSYEYVLKDLALSWHKVKPGGFLTGDDYNWGEKEGFPVRRAVHDFVEDKKIDHKLEVLVSQYIIRL